MFVLRTKPVFLNRINKKKIIAPWSGYTLLMKNNWFLNFYHLDSSLSGCALFLSNGFGCAIFERMGYGALGWGTGAVYWWLIILILINWFIHALISQTRRSLPQKTIEILGGLQGGEGGKIQVQMIKFKMFEEFIHRRGVWIHKLIHEIYIAKIQELENGK